MELRNDAEDRREDMGEDMMLILGSQMSYDIDFIFNELDRIINANTKKEMTYALRLIASKAADIKMKVNAKGDAYFTEQWQP